MFRGRRKGESGRLNSILPDGGSRYLGASRLSTKDPCKEAKEVPGLTD